MLGIRMKNGCLSSRKTGCRWRVLGRLIVTAMLIDYASASAATPDLQLGIAHVGGLYSLTDQDYLNEGAAAVRDIGARCIKVSLTLDTANPTPRMYPFHSRWPDVATLDALADTPYFRSLFSRAFDTFILISFRPGKTPDYWRTSFNREDEDAEEACFAALARTLLESHADETKTFVIQNWEGDWAVRGSFDPQSTPTEAAFRSMIRWLSARQRGIARGRAEARPSRSQVFHACEVNLVAMTMERETPSVTTHVLPNVNVDLVSYSAWDTRESPERFGRAIDFIAARKRSNPSSLGCGIYIGEFGIPEQEASPNLVRERCAALITAARQRGCPYAVYWQLYCNEPIVQPPRINADFKGYWLIRPDGSRSPACELFRP